jgi:hypothetical protein
MDVNQPKLRFAIPFLLSKDDNPNDYANLRSTKICGSALLDIIGKGKKWRYKCRNHAISNTLPSHGLKGRVPNNKRKWNDLYEVALEQHFEQLVKEAEPTAVGLVRELTGETSLRNALVGQGQQLLCSLHSLYWWMR